AAAIRDPAVSRAVARLAFGEGTAGAWWTVGAGMIHQSLEAPGRRLGPSWGDNSRPEAEHVLAPRGPST
ncbi:MAG: hypothetical protein ACYC1Z_05105, partial [Georgenia sp.]